MDENSNSESAHLGSTDLSTDLGTLPKRADRSPSAGGWYRKWWAWLLIAGTGASFGFLAGTLATPGEAESASEGAADFKGAEEQSPSIATEPQVEAADESAPLLPLTEAGYPSFEAQMYTGTGSETISVASVQGPLALSFDCPACSGPVALLTDIPSDKVLVDAEGPFAGTIVAAVRGEPLQEIQVEADSNWTVMVQELASLPKIAGNMDAMGVNAFIYTGEAEQALITHSGDGPFSVSVYGLSDPTVVDTQGDFEGEVPVKRGVIAIRTEGVWSFTPAVP